MEELIWKYVKSNLSFTEKKELSQLLEHKLISQEDLNRAKELDLLLKDYSTDFPDQIVLCNIKSMIELELDLLEPAKFDIWKPIAWEMIIGACMVIVGMVFFYSDWVMPSVQIPEAYFQSLLMGTMIATTFLVLLSIEKLILKSKSFNKQLR
jgi:hypothetical protein